MPDPTKVAGIKMMEPPGNLEELEDSVLVMVNDLAKFDPASPVQRVPVGPTT